VSETFFRDALDALIGFLPEELAGFDYKVHNRGLKVWFGDPVKEHYEVQEVGRFVDATGKERAGHALEIGFHCEHSNPATNAEVLQRLVAREKTWRRALGKPAAAGTFVGDRSKTWQRLSEFWTGPEIDEPDTAIEAADRLAAYITALEPIRTKRPTRAR
jgi:hypothetical protein